MGTDSCIIAYVATPHAGYLKFFRAYAGSTLYVLGQEFIRDFQPLVRNLPAATPEEVQQMVQALGIFSDVRVLAPSCLEEVRARPIVMPDEDVSHALAEEFFSGAAVTFDGRWRLRWDWGTATANRRPEGERIISVDELDRELMHRAFAESSRSPDWWRQIGALLVRDGRILITAYNRHIPHEQSNYCYGDPRSNFGPGEHIEISGAAHAEMVVAGTALARGICTVGCSLYVSTFPCPPCATPWSFSGLRRLYYCEGYSLVAAAENLQNQGIEIIRVEMAQPPS